MLIIGERINSTRKGVQEAIEKKDAAFIQEEALKQFKSGAHFIDINCGNPDEAKELENLEWAIGLVQKTVDAPLCVDSSSVRALEKGLSLCNKPGMINSTTGEKKMLDKILPLAKKYNARLVALTNDEKGMPKTAEDRIKIAEYILKEAKNAGVPEENIYFDCLVRPISAEPDQAVEFLRAVTLIKKLGDTKTACGLSNVSFGLPQRKLINSTFMCMAIYAGLDAAIVDPTDSRMLTSIFASEALIVKDEYCMNYITAIREGRLS
ncbi:MAG: dihydropteroate synthase [Candidatus Omnitrophica bacterium]|nr:dihydropteroate synthase [Candidatus Omnitrophota bacterium]